MLKRFQRFLTVIGSSAVIFSVAVPVNAYEFDINDEQVFRYYEGIALALPTEQPSGGWRLPVLRPDRSSRRLTHLELTDNRFEPGERSTTARKGLSAGIQGFRVYNPISGGSEIEMDASVTNVQGVTFENTFADTVIQADAQSINIRLSGTAPDPGSDRDLWLRIFADDSSRVFYYRLIFCDSPQGTVASHCALVRIIDRLASRNRDIVQEVDRLSQVEEEIAAAEMERNTAIMQLATAQEQVMTLTGDRDATQAQLAAAQARVTQLIEQLRGLGVEPVPAPAAAGDGGGSSGAGAIGAVAIAAGAYYWWKTKNPTSKLSFMAMPTDTDAYVAEFNATPKENLHFNVRYTEGNLFADSDFVKPETNSTVMATVKWTW